jgi:two-component sensor histidine kinase
MATLADLASERTELSPDDIEQLQALVAEWSLLSDLAFSDLVLWLPTWNDGGFVAGAQVRPTTGPTRIPQDIVGQFTAKGRQPVLDRVLSTQKMVKDRNPLRPLVPLSIEGVPIIRGGRVIAILIRHSSMESRTEGNLERHYLEAFEALAEMTSGGLFPYGFGVGLSAAPPRVGDGLLRLDVEGVVEFASPNAVSACHRLGLAFGIDGQHLANTLMRLTRSPGPVNESLMLVAGGRAPGETEINNAGAVLTLRSLPLTVNNQSLGALVLLRDVSELRRRESALLTKDATIREIHHRVKNNLQTVAALLRLQARRSDSEEVREALEEAQRRVAAIATVHETLAHEPGSSVDFDEVADRLILMVRDMTRGMRQGTVTRHGSFGVLRSEHATTLAMVLTELISNAIEHGISLRETEGAVLVNVSRGENLVVSIEDDGPGLPEAGIVEGLGLSIVRTIVTQDLKGSLVIENQATGGTRAQIVIPIGMAK